MNEKQAQELIEILRDVEVRLAELVACQRSIARSQISAMSPVAADDVILGEWQRELIDQLWREEARLTPP